MANCEITDLLGYWSADGTFVGIQDANIYAVPDLTSRRYPDGTGAYRTLALNPNVVANTAFQHGRIATTASGGSFTFQLPYGIDSTHPSTPAPKWTIALPDGKLLTGPVPDDAGPFTLDQLAAADGTGVAAWVWSNEVYVAPVTAGVLAKGVAAFSAASSAIILFSTPISGAYGITLTSSVDTVTGQVPSIGYTSKSSSGFTITASETFTGEVSWRAEQ
jgi:hypothetical protein